MPTIKQLKVFASIARHGNLGDAACELFLSKGAISQSLNQLEQQLDTPLFDRVHPKLKLNEQGRTLQPMAEELLSRMEDIIHLFDLEAYPKGVIKLGASQTIGNYLLPDLLALEPTLDTRVTIANTFDLCEKLTRFDLDLALIEGVNHHPDLVLEPWLEDEMLLVAPPSHPLSQEKVIRFEQLNQNRWVLREPLSGSREQFDTHIKPQITKLGPILELNTLEAIMLAVEKGLGLTFVSRLAVKERLESKRLIQLNLTGYYPRQLHLAWHKNKYHSVLIRHFIRLCQNQRPTR